MLFMNSLCTDFLGFLGLTVFLFGITLIDFFAFFLLTFGLLFGRDYYRFWLCLLLAPLLHSQLERRRCVVPLDVGWTLITQDAGYANGRRYTQTSDGEIYDIAVTPPPLEENSTISLLRSDRSDLTWDHAVNVLKVVQAVTQSATTRESVPVS